MKYVEDSRIPADLQLNVPKIIRNILGKQTVLAEFFAQEWLVGAVFLIGFLILLLLRALASGKNGRSD